MCFIQCYGEQYCQKTMVIPTSSNLHQLVVVCKGRSSCQFMEIEIINTEITKFSLICSSGLSCDSTKINITSSYTMQIEIYCNDDGGLSCQQMHIDLNAGNNDNVFNTTLGCYNKASCNDLYLNANEVEEMSLTIEMYEYSKNVQIAYKKYKEIELICNTQDSKRFMRYNVDKSHEKTESEMYQLASLHYNGNLPCEGIIIYCSGKDNNESYQCSVQYQSLYTVNQTEIFTSNQNVICYWIDINKLYQPIISCFTECIQINSDSTGDKSTDIISSETLIYILIISICVLCIILLILYIRLKQSKKVMEIMNPMVLLIAIQYYDQINDLDGLEHDIKNLSELFSKLNYECLPQTAESVLKNDIIKLHWTKQQLLVLLKATAKDFANNLHEPNTNPYGYDGLICVISSHGYNQQIITSDNKKIGKKKIHRIFSEQYPLSRDFPRIFLYDCCEGNQECAKGHDQSKVRQKSLSRDNSDEHTDTWRRGDHNPDHKLALLHAANKDFQSKLRTDKGSYMIQLFFKKAMKNVDNDDIPILGEIFDKIQTELDDRNKQFPTYEWNNQTRLIKLKKKKKCKARDTQYDTNYDENQNEMYRDDDEEKNIHVIEMANNSNERKIEENADESDTSRTNAINIPAGTCDKQSRSIALELGQSKSVSKRQNSKQNYTIITGHDAQDTDESDTNDKADSSLLQ
eukprot:466534_1